MVNYKNGGHLQAYAKRAVQRQNKIDLIQDDKTVVQIQNKSKKYVTVETLVSRVKSERELFSLTSKKMPTYVDDLLWQTSSKFSVLNLPKVEDYDFRRLNFAFGRTREEIEQNYDEMVSTPKVVVSFYAHKYKKAEHVYNIVKIYSIAPNLKNKNLPVIYRTDIITDPDNNKFFGVKCLAIVGGCLDGECPLFQVSKHDRQCARLYKIKSGNTIKDVDPEDDVSNIFYDVTEVDGVVNLDSAVEFAFSKFGLNHTLDKGQFPNGKIFEMIETLSRKNSPSLLKLDAKQYVKQIMESEVQNNFSNINQIVLKADGTVQNTAFENKQKILEQKNKVFN